MWKPDDAKERGKVISSRNREQDRGKQLTSVASITEKDLRSSISFPADLAQLKKETEREDGRGSVGLERAEMRRSKTHISLGSVMRCYSCGRQRNRRSESGRGDEEEETLRGLTQGRLQLRRGLTSTERIHRRSPTRDHPLLILPLIFLILLVPLILPLLLFTLRLRLRQTTIHILEVQRPLDSAGILGIQIHRSSPRRSRSRLAPSC